MTVTPTLEGGVKVSDNCRIVIGLYKAEKFLRSSAATDT